MGRAPGATEPNWLTTLARCDWLTAERGRVYGSMLAVAGLVLLVWTLVAPVAGTAPGGDFLSFYSASRLALVGRAADAWRPELHEAIEHALVPGFAHYLAFFYPPPYLLICLPLGLLPLGVALALWTATTGLAAALGLLALVRAAGGRSAWPALVLFAGTGFWLNAMVGQNGALSLAILGLGFALLDRRPILAGCVLGLMIIKPQLVIALPFLLVGAGRWRAFLACGVSVLVYLALAWLAFGTDAYAAFLSNVFSAQSSVSEARVDPALMVSIASGLSRLGLPFGVALSVQVGATLIGLAVALKTARGRTGFELAALLGALAPVLSPYLLDYDLVVSALAFGYLLFRIEADGSLGYEKLGLALVALFPLPGRMLSLLFGLPLAQVISLLCLVLVLRRLPPVPRHPSGVAQS